MRKLANAVKELGYNMTQVTMVATNYRYIKVRCNQQYLLGVWDLYKSKWI